MECEGFVSAVENELLQGGDSIEKIQLEFWLEKTLESWHEKNLQLRHASESKLSLKPFLKLKLKPKDFPLNRVSVLRLGRGHGRQEGPGRRRLRLRPPLRPRHAITQPVDLPGNNNLIISPIVVENCIYTRDRLSKITGYKVKSLIK